MKDAGLCWACGGGGGVERKVKWSGRNQESTGMWHSKYTSIFILIVFSSPYFRKKLCDLFYFCIWFFLGGRIESGRRNILASGLKVHYPEKMCSYTNEYTSWMKIWESKFPEWLNRMLVYLEWGHWFSKCCRKNKPLWIIFWFMRTLRWALVWLEWTLLWKTLNDLPKVMLLVKGTVVTQTQIQWPNPILHT